MTDLISLNHSSDKVKAHPVYGTLRGIVTHKQYAKVNGVTVDLFTGSALWQVVNALNEQNAIRLMSMPTVKMVNIMWRVVKETK